MTQLPPTVWPVFQSLPRDFRIEGKRKAIENQKSYFNRPGISPWTPNSPLSSNELFHCANITVTTQTRGELPDRNK